MRLGALARLRNGEPRDDFRPRSQIEDLATAYLRGEWSGATSPAEGSLKGGRGDGQQPGLRGEGRDWLEPVQRRVNPTTPPRASFLPFPSGQPSANPGGITPQIEHGIDADDGVPHEIVDA